MIATNKVWLVVLIVLLSASGFYAYQQVQRGSAAYIYGYPLVLMDLTRQALALGGSSPDSSANQFTHSQVFPDHTFRNVVRPNNDTLYSSAWLDLSVEPLVLSVPDTQGRYYVMPLMDAWTNVFATVGKRSYGAQAGQYLIVGPGWRGEIPEDTVKIVSPTNMVWIIGRIQTNGKEDIPNVAALQEQFTLTHLSQWGQGPAPTGIVEQESMSSSSIDPYQQLQAMTAGEFLSRLAVLMAEQAPGPQDGPVLDELGELGLIPGQTFAPEQLGVVDDYLLNLALKLTRNAIREQLDSKQNSENGWAVQRDTIGNYGANYNVRAAVAMIGLGALPPAEASYPNTEVDSQGEQLSGAHSYRIHFTAGETPPVKAFWSLTMYDQEGFLVDNPIARYTLGDRDPLDYNEDGSLDLLIQHNTPTQGQSNWLPAPAGEFALTMRIYHAKQEFLDGSWQLPAVERLD